MGIDEKIHQGSTDSIVVASTRSNVLPKDAHKQTIQRKKSSNLTNNPLRPIQISEQLLVSQNRRVNAMTNRSGTTIGIAP
jgi:hypothetical protein